MRIATDLLHWWAIASDAEKMILRVFGFTICTPAGVNVAMDFFHEKYVRLIWDTTGKVFLHGHKAKIEFNCVV